MPRSFLVKKTLSDHENGYHYYRPRPPKNDEFGEERLHSVSPKTVTPYTPSALLQLSIGIAPIQRFLENGEVH